MKNLQELLLNELRDLYNAENQLVKALPKMAKAASNQELRTAYQEHTEQTRGQVERLRQCFEHLGLKAKGQPCEAMQGLIQEGQELIEEGGAAPVCDVGLVGASEKIEHYEISGYESVVMMAKMMGLNQVADLLQQTLKEEQETAQRLHKMAKPMMMDASRMSSSGESEKGSSRTRSRQDNSRSSSSSQARSRSQARNSSARRTTSRNA